jgi:1-acyl-sn-glycerol-3-phosphate acyltransferase
MISVRAPGSDCEALDEYGAAQDVNAWTSLGYVAVGVLVADAVRRRRLLPVALLLALLSVLEGAGSVLFHGWPGDVSQWLHDVPFVAMLGLVAGAHLGRLTAAGLQRGAWIGGLGVLAVAGIVHPFASGAVNAVAGVLVALIVVTEVVARRRHLPAIVRAGLLALVVLAVAVYLLGRTDSPLCDPDSWAQLHGVWHLLTAFAVLVWADRGLAVAGPATGARILRNATDIAIGWLALSLVRGFHRSVDVTDRDLLPPRGAPTLIVANHGNGFVDPIVVAAAIHRLPRFIAKATLWKILPARFALDALAVLPVHRRADGDDPAANAAMFAASHEALRRHDMVAIFPEGTTGDRAHLDRVRSGAARIALGACDDGVAGIRIAPVGMAFESRVDTRTRASVTFGAPIDVDSFTGDATELTEVIRSRLAAVSPEFETVDEREQLRMAAAIELRAAHPRGAAPRFGAIVRRSAQIAAAPASQRAEVVDALARWALRAEMTGLGAEDLADGALRRGGGRIVAAALAVVLVGPLLVTATLVNLPALVLVRLGVASVRSTATKGTVRMLVGLLTIAATWITIAVLVADGWAILAALAVIGTISALALATWTWVVGGVTTLWAAARRHDRRQWLPALEAARDDVVAAVRAAADAPD